MAAVSGPLSRETTPPTPSKAEAVSDKASAASRSWKRANRLANLAHHTDKNHCRGFLARYDNHAAIRSLDNPNADSRYTTIKEIIIAFNDWKQASKLPKRPSHGDATRQPRAGAPTPVSRLQPQDLVQQLLNTQKFCETNGLTPAQLVELATGLIRIANS